MNRKYLIRLDDASPTMNSYKWGRMEALLDYYNVKPMVGIVPDCKDEKLIYQQADLGFWENALSWQKKGWAIALHGYDHCYISEKGMQGLNPMWKRSEFAGVPIDIQREKIHRGIVILKDHGLKPQYFFAPSHTFDESTLVALREESDIRIISDTIALHPYYRDDFLFIPQIVGHAMKIPLPGVYTFCYHPNIMDEKDFQKAESFLNQNKNEFSSFNKIKDSEYGKKSVLGKLLSKSFFCYRKIRGWE